MKTGEVLFQSREETAKVYLHKGLVVWAFASGQKESFQSILLKENRLSKETLLEGIRESRRTGKRNLNDILILLGVSNQDERQTIVERHTRAAIKVIIEISEPTVQFNALPESSSETVFGLGLETLLPAKAEVEEPTAAPVRPSLTSSDAPTRSYKTDLTAAAQQVNDIQELLERLRYEIPSFLAAMVVEGKTSMPIAALSDAPGLDLDVVSAFYRDLIRSAQEALKAMGKTSPSPLDEVLISSQDDYVLLKSLSNGSHFLYILIDQDANPGMAKVVVKRYQSQLDSFLG